MLATHALRRLQIADAALFENSESSSSPLEEASRLRKELNQALEERNRLLKRLQQDCTRSERGRGSRILEARLSDVREALENLAQENSQLLASNRCLQTRLDELAPLPLLFLTRMETLAHLAIGSTSPITAVAALESGARLSARFAEAASQLHQVLEHDHVLDNQQLRQERTVMQTQIANLERDYVQSRQHADRLESVMGRATQELRQRDERLAGLVERLNQLEADNLRLVRASVALKSQIRERRGPLEPERFTFIPNGGYSQHGKHRLERLVLWAAAILLLATSASAGFWFGNAQAPNRDLTAMAATAYIASAPAIKPTVTPLAVARGTHQDHLPGGGIAPLLVAISAGTFNMGSDRYESPASEKPAHVISVGNFLLGRYEVTFDEYDTFARATGRALPADAGFGRGTHPVINVTWDDAYAYTGWLTAQTGQHYRLPSAAEWEFALAGGRPDLYWWGNRFESGREVCFNCGTNWDNRSSAPVGSVAANPLGLYDMGGNVMEWVADCAESGCATRVVRGSAYNRPSDSLRTTAHHVLPARERFPMVGFRVARED